MNWSLHHDELIVRTPFSPEYDLVQIMQGVLPPEKKPKSWNAPVDFKAAALVRKEVRDIWHFDRCLSFATDEVPPLVLGDEDIGGNHGYPCLVRAEWEEGSALAALTEASEWTDGEGTRWTVIRPPFSDGGKVVAFFLSEADSTLSKTAFKSAISSYLRSGDTRIPVLSQSGRHDYLPSIRHTGCLVEESSSGDFLSLRESYDILHPGRTLSDFPFSDPVLVHVSNEYRFSASGELTIHFTYRAGSHPIRIQQILGTMYQEKCDLGGGNWRMIPGTLPFSAISEAGAEEPFDFSRPVNTSSARFPARTVCLTKEYWSDPNRPPLSQIDEMKDASGHTVCLFEAGFPSRPFPVETAWMIVPSRKTYPVFAENVTLSPHQSLSGSAFRRYVSPHP